VRYSKELREVESALRSLPPSRKTEIWMAKNYVGAGKSRFEFLDLPIPTLDGRLRLGFSFSGRTVPELWRIWDSIFRSTPVFEAATAAIAFASDRPVEELSENRSLLLRWVERSDNWATSDGLSSLYSRILEHDRGGSRRRPPLLDRLELWSESRNPWKRRQSLVSLLYYSSVRDRSRILPFRRLIGFVESRLEDPHYYVQKGVGWTVREIQNVYPEETFRWLRRNVGRISAAAWQASTEKLPAARKSELKSIRNEARRARKA
jgi:3-methyladenine DNA glycosylase AlkD